MAAPFIARVTADPRSHSHPIPDAASAAEAAILFSERWGTAAGEVSITVTEAETGHEQCFRIDLGDHTAEPC